MLPIRLMRVALCGHAELLAEHYGKTIVGDDLRSIRSLADEQCSSFGTQKGRRQAFETVAKFVLDRLGLLREPDVVAAYRAAALADAGMDVSGRPMQMLAGSDPPQEAATNERFLDSEFIAIYW